MPCNRFHTKECPWLSQEFISISSCAIFDSERSAPGESSHCWGGKEAALAQDLETQMFDDLRLLPALSLLDPRSPLGPALRARSQTRLLWRGTAGWSKTPYCLFRQGVAHGGTASSSKSCRYGERTNKQQSCGARNTRKSLVLRRSSIWICFGI